MSVEITEGSRVTTRYFGGYEAVIVRQIHSDFWGWGPNRDGKNMLGKLWMKVRRSLAQTGGKL